MLRNDRTEADDLIARWIDKHPDIEHVIISTDKDLNQLITPRVKQYNGVNEVTMTHEGWFDSKGNPVIDKKLKAPKPAPDVEWLVFEKSMRGDPSDNIFSAYPGVRTKGTKNKIGLTEAFADKDSKVSQPFVVEFKHTAKLTDDHRKELLQQLKFGQNTFLNKNDDLNYGFLWNIVKHKYQVSNEIIREISVATLDDLTRELEKVNEYKEKEEKIKFLGDLFMTILKDTPKIFSLKKFAGEVDTYLKDHDLTIGEVLSNFEPSYKEVFNNSLKEGSLFKLEVDSDPKVELELWKITGVDQNLSMELIKSY